MMLHLAILVLSIGGFQLLALARSKITARRQKTLFWLAWLLLLVALALSVSYWRVGPGLALWTGYLSAGAGTVFLLRLILARFGLEVN